MSKARVLRYLLDTLPRQRPISSARLLDENAVLVKMQLGEKIAIYCLEGSLSLSLIAKALNTNTYRDIHTMFILMPDVLPHNGAAAQPSEALRLLLSVYDNRLYAAKTLGQVSIFPVYFDEFFKVTYGKPVDLNDLSGDYTLVETVHVNGVRHVADFERTYYHAESFTGVRLERHPLQQYYEVLGVTVDASEENIKRAYREKAHQCHPDRDPSPDATARMQRINEAYEQIMKQWR